MPRPNPPDVLGVNFTASRNIPYEIERSPECFAGDFGRLPFETSAAECEPCIFCVATESFEIGWLQGELTVRSLVGAAQRKVFLDYSGAEANGSKRHSSAKRVVRQARNGAEPAGDFGQLAQIGLVHRGRVRADAVEEHQTYSTKSHDTGVPDLIALVTRRPSRRS